MTDVSSGSYSSKEKRSRAPSSLFKDSFLDMDDFSDFDDEEMDSEMKDIFQNLTPLASSSSSSHRPSLLLSSIASPVLHLKQQEEEEEDEEEEEEGGGDVEESPRADLSPDSKKTKGKLGTFKCKACGESFSESWTLANHAKSNHPDYPRRDDGTFKKRPLGVKKFPYSPLLSNNNSGSPINTLENKTIKPQQQKRKRGRPPKSTQKLNYFGKNSGYKNGEDEDDLEEDEEDEVQNEESLSELGEIIQQILCKINDFADGIQPQPDNDPYKNFEVFKEFDGQKSKKRKLSDFLAKNIDSLMQLPTKVEVSMQDFRNSTLGEKVRQKLDNLKTLKKAMELGLIFEEQFEEKQKQFLDSFSFSLAC